MNEKLKPCPFCGSKNIVVAHTKKLFVYRSICKDCGADNCKLAETEEDAIKLWNTRPIEDALQARIAELEWSNL
jgi:Lar family restriction alleviation protein